MQRILTKVNKPEEPKVMRSYLYHQEYPKGKLFDDNDIPELLTQGWVEAPWLIDNYEATHGLPQCEEPAVVRIVPNQDKEELKPWQKAQAARKAKKLAQGGK